MTGCREAGRLLLWLVLARSIAVVPTIDRDRGGAAAWSWSILFPTIERPETTPMRWAGSGADGRWLNREREKEREVVFLARPIAVVPTIDRDRGGAAAWSWSILFPTIERPETTPMRLSRVQSGPRLNVCR